MKLPAIVTPVTWSIGAFRALRSMPMLPAAEPSSPSRVLFVMTMPVCGP